jgi:hypothetical protein
MCTVGYCDNALIHACIPLAQAKNGPEPVVPESDADQDCVAQKTLAIALLDKRLDLLEFLLRSVKQNRSLEFDAHFKSLALPDERASDRILRYETHLDRQLYRAMDQLERLQRRRKGENVPPPLNFNLGGHSVFAKQSH